MHTGSQSVICVRCQQQWLRSEGESMFYTCQSCRITDTKERSGCKRYASHHRHNRANDVKYRSVDIFPQHEDELFKGRSLTLDEYTYTKRDICSDAHLLDTFLSDLSDTVSEDEQK